MPTAQKDKILLVEDEESLAIGLKYNLTEEGYTVTWVDDGKAALEAFATKIFDLIILDIMLPYYDGFEIARIIREKTPQLPILMLTAKASPDDRVAGLESGADDYLTKPFHLPELILRIQGMLKRRNWYKETTELEPVYRFGENEVNFTDFSVKTAKTDFRLTQREALMLRYFVEHRGKIVTRQELLSEVWNINSDIETRTVDNFIARLRKYFEPDPAKPIYFKSIRSAGYLFTDSENAET